ncbi:MAG TPA: hypothetical protein VGN18_14490 [Jatrophihabitans sp.]|jgi:hypothetical protein|uniref:hypothetical protein n=1 Tax=Jatrophihabitans sp. TaxID=1932789 RepID=UPI002DF9677D|nr:hypothetical protein [Jatrophihabitans sp.]
MKRVVLRRLILSLAVLGALLGAAAGTLVNVSGAAGRPDFSLGLGKTRVSVRASESALVSVQVNRLNGFTAPVTVSLAGAPRGSRVTVTPQPNVDTNRPSTFTITVPGNTVPGSYPLTVVGTSGVLRHTGTLTLGVTAAPAPRITISATPSTVNARRNATGTFAISLGRTDVAGPIALSVRGVPAYATAVFAPAVAFGISSSLTVATSLSTPLGSADLVITATSATASASITVHLAVSAGSEGAFTITGSPDRRLAPGVTGLIDVSVTNPNAQTLQLSALTVVLAAASDPGCTLDNFRVTQFSGPYPLTIPARSTRTLSQLGLPRTAWPTLTLLDLPVNQNACKNNSLALSYSGVGGNR